MGAGAGEGAAGLPGDGWGVGLGGNEVHERGEEEGGFTTNYISIQAARHASGHDFFFHISQILGHGG